MRVAFDALFGQMHHRGIAAVTIDAIGKHPCHLQAYTPTVHCPIITRLIGNVVAVINDDRETGQFLEVSQRNGCCPQCPEWTDGLQGFGCLAFGKDEAAARFVGDNGTYLVVLDGGMPARSAAL